MDPRPSTRIFSAWDLLALAGFLGLAFYYLSVLPRLPDPVPTHFDAAGHANGWTSKASLPWVFAGVTGLPWLILLGVGAMAAFLPHGSGRNQASAIHPLRGFLGLGTSALMGACLAFPLTGGRSLPLGLGVFVVCLLAGIGLLLRESARTLKEVSRSGKAPEAGHFRWGLFYVNEEDPRLWVEKPVGYGWTLNFAKPSAYLVLVLLLLPVAGVLMLAKGTGKH